MSNGTIDRQTVEQDIALMVGGRFAADHVGPDVVNEVSARALANAGSYLDAMEESYLGTKFDAMMHSNLRVSALLNFLTQREPTRVRDLAQRLVSQYNAVLVVYDSVVDKEALKTLLPTDALNLAIRLDRQRAGLRGLAGA